MLMVFNRRFLFTILQMSKLLDDRASLATLVGFRKTLFHQL